MKRSTSLGHSIAHVAPHSSKTKRERFMIRLVDKVKGILESAVQNDDKNRQSILQELFSNISCQVEDEVLSYLESDHKLDSKAMMMATENADKTAATNISKISTSSTATPPSPPPSPPSPPPPVLISSADLPSPSTTPAPDLVSPPPPLITPPSDADSTGSISMKANSPSVGDSGVVATGSGNPIYYYELLAERFAARPSEVTSMFQMLVSLWTNTTFPMIFAALFYKWMFRHGTVQMKNFNIFIKGANRLFWLDLETINTRFAPIYKFLNNEVLANYNSLWNIKDSDRGHPPTAVNDNVLTRFILDFFNVLARFFFYYQKVSDLPQFIQNTQDIFSHINNSSSTSATPTPTSPLHSTATPVTSDESRNTVTLASTDISNAQSPPTSSQELARISAADNFVDCTIRQIKLIKNEYVLVKYIQKCVHFQGLTLRDTTQVKLQTLLYDYTSPGGPAYPPRSVRHAATESLDALFPTGKLPRRYIHLFFRLLHPYYATRSIFHWIYSYVKPFLFIFGTPLEEEEDENVLKSIE